ncbi:MAG: sterol desaturase family protein [Bryobacteraceae bacterium]|jgi:sterol desaturase/sphingolipid hydroxylase (fatty acid hydroxylase superfamily)
MMQPFVPLLLDVLRLCVWLVLLLIIFVPLERRWTLHRQKFLRKAFGTDLVYYFVGGLVPKLLLIAPMTLIAAGLHHIWAGGLYSWAAAMPLLIRLPAALVVGETGSYWGHRWSHEIPWLWRFHALHHSAEEIDWLVNSRAHPVDLVFTRLCALVPMYMLGLAQPMGNRVDLVPILVTVAGTLWGFFIHANVSWRFGWLEWLVSSPAFHHWHHTNDGPERINKNYASMLPCLDKCFGTFYLPKQAWPVKYGIDTPIHSGLAQQLLNPLKQ